MVKFFETKTNRSPLVNMLTLQGQASKTNFDKAKGSLLKYASKDGSWGSLAPPSDASQGNAKGGVQDLTDALSALSTSMASLTPLLPSPAMDEVRSDVWDGLVRQSSIKHFIPRIEKHYKQITCFDLLLQCPLDGVMTIPSLDRVVVNNTSKRVIQDKKELVVGLSATLMVSGQKPQVRWAKKSIAGFKLRRGEPLGCKVTLRRRRMYAFLDKLAYIALPRARPSTITHKGATAYYIGIGDPFQFYELEHHYDLFQSVSGFDVVLLTVPTQSSNCTSLVSRSDARSDAKALATLLWSGLQFIT